MIKKILLKLAYKINKHYKTIEISYEDTIKCYDRYFKIVRMSYSKEVGRVDTVEIEAHDTIGYLDKIKYKINKNILK